MSVHYVEVRRLMQSHYNGMGRCSVSYYTQADGKYNFYLTRKLSQHLLTPD